MKFQLPDRIMRWLGPAIISGVGMALIFGNPLGIKTLCEGTSNCLVTWVGALSGWAAAATAGVTVVYLSRQMFDQKKQIDFATGEAAPTIEVGLHAMLGEILLVRIVNWNRSGIAINGIEVIPTKPDECRIGEMLVNGEPWDKEARQHRPYLKGWEDRQGPPCVLTSMIVGPTEFGICGWSPDTEVICHIEIADRQRARHTLKARLYSENGSSFDYGWLHPPRS